MKLTRDEIKQKLAEILEKQGASISELEAVLTMSKQSNVNKQSNMLTDLLGVGWKASLLGGGLSALGGGAAGLAGYTGYKQIQNSEDRINAKLYEKRQYNDAIELLDRYVASRQDLTTPK